MKEICKPNASYIITGSIYKKTSKQEVKDAYTVIGALNFVGAFFFLVDTSLTTSRDGNKHNIEINKYIHNTMVKINQLIVQL